MVAQDLDIAVFYVTAIFAEMNGYAICACVLGYIGRMDRIWIVSTTRISESRNVVDVDPK